MASSFPLLHMFDSLIAAHQTRRPCVLHGGLHPQDDWGFQRPMIYRAVQKADAYIANTNFEANYVITKGAVPERVFPVGLGVYVERFEGIQTIEARTALGLPTDDAPLVGYIGQLGQHKGVQTLLKAMPKVWSQVPQARLLIAGAVTPFAEKLEAIKAQFTPRSAAARNIQV
jgi:glycosyltransferase involved in cell wall biosynthesis